MLEKLAAVVEAMSCWGGTSGVSRQAQLPLVGNLGEPSSSWLHSYVALPTGFEPAPERRACGIEMVASITGPSTLFSSDDVDGAKRAAEAWFAQMGARCTSRGSSRTSRGIGRCDSRAASAAPYAARYGIGRGHDETAMAQILAIPRAGASLANIDIYCQMGSI